MVKPLHGLITIVIFLCVVAGAVEAATPQQVMEFLASGERIRIGLAQSQESVAVKAQGSLQLLTTDGKILGELSSGEELVVSLVRSAGARGRQTVYRLQVQANRDREAAEAMAAQLQRRVSWPVDVVVAEPWYKVQVGNFPTPEQAESAKPLLAELGFPDAWTVSHHYTAQGRAAITAAGWDLPEDLQELQVVPQDPQSRVVVSGRAYRGDLHIFVDGDLALTVVNVIALDDYLYGVVAAEMGNATPEQMQALMAQAVAARSYAINHLGQYGEKDFDLVGTVMSQAYYGSQRENPAIRQAVKATSGQVLVFGGEIVGALFHSNAGGHTAFPQEVWEGNVPYVLGRQEVADEIEGTLGTSHNTYRWQREFTQDQLLRILQTADPGQGARQVLDVVVAARGPSGRVTELVLVTDQGRVVGTRDRIRQLLTTDGTLLPSTRFTIDKIYREGELSQVILRGWGSGHGLGLSQAGAMELASAGWSYDRILAHYYPYAALQDLDVYRTYAEEDAKLAPVDLMKAQWDAKFPGEGTVTHLSYSPDGTRLAWLHAEQGLWVWDGLEAKAVVPAESAVKAYLWLTPHQLVYIQATETEDELVWLDLASGEQRALGKGRFSGGLSYQRERDILYAHRDGMIWAYLGYADVWLPILTDAREPVISPDGSQLAFVRKERAWVYNTKTGQAVGIKGDAPVETLAWAPSGDYLAVQTKGAIQVYETEGFREVFSAKGQAMQWSGDGRFLSYCRPYGDEEHLDVFVVIAGEWYEFNLTHTQAATESLAVWHPSGWGIALHSHQLNLLQGDGSHPVPVIWQVRLRGKE